MKLQLKKICCTVSSSMPHNTQIGLTFIPNLIILSLVRSLFLKANHTINEHLLIERECQTKPAQSGVVPLDLIEFQIVPKEIKEAWYPSHIIWSEEYTWVRTTLCLNSIKSLWLDIGKTHGWLNQHLQLCLGETEESKDGFLPMDHAKTEN